MTVRKLCEALNLKIAAGSGGADKEVSGCFIGDLLSHAMSSLEEGNIWITIQTNINIAAIAALTGAACVLVCDGHIPDEDTSKRADAENISVLLSDKPAYEIACELYRLGI